MVAAWKLLLASQLAMNCEYKMAPTKERKVRYWEHKKGESSISKELKLSECNWYHKMSEPCLDPLLEK